jgi:hypothetical protein
MKIYELKQQQQELLDELYWLEDFDSTSVVIKAKLEQIEGSIERKLSYLSDVLAEAIALSQLSTERRKIAEERLERKEKQAKRAEEKLREFILSVMVDFGIKSVNGDLLSLSHYQSAGSVKFAPDFDVNSLPDDCKKIIPEEIKPIAADIAKRLKAGKEIAGVWLEKKEVLKIS